MPPSSIKDPHKINNGTATIINEFIAVNIDCAAMLSGKSVINIIEITDAAPKDTAIGTPKNINSINIPINTQLINLYLAIYAN